MGMAATGSILVCIRNEDGKPFSGIPQLTLSVDNQSIPQTARMVGNAWAYSSLATRVTYEIDVRVDGYQPAREIVMIPDIDGASAAVMIFMKPLDGRLAFHPPMGQFLLAPRAQKEVAKGLRDLQSNKLTRRESISKKR